MDCFIDVFEHLYSLFDVFVLELVVTVVLPDPISTQCIYLLLEGCLLSLLFFLFLCYFTHLCLHFWVCHSEGIFSAAWVWIQDGTVLVVWLLHTHLSCTQHLQVLCLFLSYFCLLVTMIPHSLNCLEGNESGKCYFHGIGISLDKILVRQFISLVEIFKNLSWEVDLVSQEIVPKESLDDHFPVDEVK